MTAIEDTLRESARRDVEATAAEAALRLAERAGREGLADVAYALIDSPLGTLLAARTEHGLVRLAYSENDHDSVLAKLSQRISPRVVEAPSQLDGIRRELDEYFAGTRRAFDLPIDWTLVRTPFSRRILQATARVRFGSATTYAGVAAEAGSARAVRAAGNALGANPMPIVVPCHRVLRTGGGLGGYTGGLEKKRVLLELEGVEAG